MRALQVLVFAGTTEGRQICLFLAEHGMQVTACVATEYGEAMLPPDAAGLQVHTGRMSAGDMETFLRPYSLVIDATHPYAREVTANIKQACTVSGKEYIRLVRPGCALPPDAILVPDIASAAQFLSRESGTVFLTTGSRELEPFTTIPNFAERFYVRVLPNIESLNKCRNLGFDPARIICMQGPFSREINAAMFRAANARFIVTKESGDVGGFTAKLEAASDAGARTVIVTRPQQEEGMTLEQLEKDLAARFSLEISAGFGSEIPMIRQKSASFDGYPRFPLFVDLTGKKAILVGGGAVSARRVQTLRRFGAQITVISPALCPALECIYAAGEIEWRARKYQKGDLQGAFLVSAATDDREVNQAVGQEAAAAGIFCSVADSREEGNFYFPAVAVGQGIVAGVVSDGTNHHRTAAVAAEIRRLPAFDVSGNGKESGNKETGL